MILAPREGTRATRASLSRRTLIGLTGAFFVTVLAFALVGLHYFYMWNQSAEWDALRREAQQVKAETAALREDARRLTDQLSFLETTAKKLEVMSNSPSARPAGVGGPSAALALDLTDADLRKHFKAVGRRRGSRNADFKKLREDHRNSGRLVSTVPNGLPVNGYPSGDFNWRSDPFSGERSFHRGVDVAAPRGTKVRATADGRVSRAGWYSDYGRLVWVDHGFGLSTGYGHLSEIAVKSGQIVRRGDIVGYVGSSGRSTGDHVHYEIRLNGTALNPLRFPRGPEEREP